MIGETKAGKTTLLATASEWLYEEHQKVLFFNTCELGGFSSRVEQRIRQGLIRPFRMRTRDDQQNSLSFETLHLASKGYVPARFLDHLTGEVEPGVDMVPPVITIYEQFCPGCGTSVKRTRYKSKLVATSCPKCKKQITLQLAPPVVTVQQTPGFEAIGSFAYDGLTSASDWLLQDMSHRKNLEGEKAALGGDVHSGDMVFRGNNRSQVGMAQTRIHELVANSLGIPNLIVMPFWTAISHESSDDTGRLQIVGPKLAGDAKTYIASSWFGNVVEAQLITNERKEYIRRLYVGQWYDEYNRRHLCGHRGDPRFMEMYYEDAPYTDEQPPTELCTGFSLKFFLNAIEESIQRGMAADDMKGMPGMASIPATYGGEVEEKPAGGSQPTTVAGGVKTAVRRQTPGKVAPKAAVAPVAPAEPAAPAAPAEPEPQEAETASEEIAAGAAEANAPDTDAPDAPSAPAADAAPAADVTGEDAAVRTAAGTAAPATPAAAAAPAQATGGWTRPAGSRPAPPRAPQAGPKPPARATPRPVQAVKPS